MAAQDFALREYPDIRHLTERMKRSTTKAMSPRCHYLCVATTDHYECVSSAGVLLPERK